MSGRHGASLTNRDVADALSAPKAISGKVEWKSLPGKYPNWVLEADVVVEGETETLRVSGRVGKTNWGLALIFRNIAIRRTGVHSGVHRNPNGDLFNEPHKHTWNETYGDKVAYIPNDIDFSDVNAAFTDFLAECNITFRGQYQVLKAV